MITYDKIMALLQQYIGTAIFPSIMDELANKLDDLCRECYEAGQGDGPL